MDKSALIGRHILPDVRQKPTNLSPLQGSTRITTRELVLNHEHAQRIPRILIQGQGSISIARRSRMKTRASVSRKKLRIKTSPFESINLALHLLERSLRQDKPRLFASFCYPRRPLGESSI